MRFVFPHARVRPVTLNMGMRMRAWYDIKTLTAEGRADEEGMRESVARVGGLIAAERALGIAPERIVIAGFSQGGARRAARRVAASRAARRRACAVVLPAAAGDARG